MHRQKKEVDHANAEFSKEFNLKKKKYQVLKNAEDALAIAKKLPANYPAAGIWKRLPGLGLDIGVGSKGNAWIVGTNRVPYCWDGHAWRNVPGLGDVIKLDVDPLGRPWGVNSRGNIYLRERDSKWYKLPGAAIDIGCGGPGSGVTWVVGTGKNYAYRWTGKTWTLLSGPDVRRIDVDNRGYAWVTNKNNDIIAFDGKTFRHKPGKAIDIACGPDGSVWILGMDKTVYMWDGKKWRKGNGQGYHITVDHKGLPWVIGLNKGTWMRTK
ncbi:tectonin domain-containing protein [Candidatus Riflebacteria bacterium]